MKKKMIGLLLVLALVVGICPAAFAASESIARATVCPYCGTALKVTTEQYHTDEVDGVCDDNPNQLHYKAYKVRLWTCPTCKDVIQDLVIATGHYCECHNGQKKCWCWD